MALVCCGFLFTQSAAIGRFPASSRRSRAYRSRGTCAFLQRMRRVSASNARLRSERNAISDAWLSESRLRERANFRMPTSCEASAVSWKEFSRWKIVESHLPSGVSPQRPFAEYADPYSGQARRCRTESGKSPSLASSLRSFLSWDESSWMDCFLFFDAPSRAAVSSPKRQRVIRREDA